MATIIKGDWLKKSHEVFDAQHSAFIFINSNGSRWVGEEPGDIQELLETLGNHPLDPVFEKYGNFITVDPCEGIANPEWNWADGNNKEQWIDGPRIFNVDGVTYFFGNFSDISHAFGIYTNDAATVAALTAAIRSNQKRYSA